MRRITNTTVIGFGANDLIAQNGIQVPAGAAATISTSTIRDNDYTPKSFVACGLLWFDANGVNDDTNVYLNNERESAASTGAAAVTRVRRKESRRAAGKPSGPPLLF
jgi:hypothetical protein